MQYFKELSDKGVTIIRNALSHHILMELEAATIKSRVFLEEYYQKDLYKISSFLASPAHIGFICPLIQPFCNRNIVSNKILFNILKEYLGKDFYLHEYVTNVALANTKTFQTPHPDQEYNLKSTAGVVCNIVFNITNKQNGMTKMWLKTHKSIIPLNTDLDKSYEAFQPQLNPGDILIRDISLLHQGTPNISNLDRYMLALVFKPKSEEILPSAVSEINKEFWDSCSLRQKRILRLHNITSKKEVHPRCYPTPKEEFLNGY